MDNQQRGQIRTEFEGAPLTLCLSTNSICALEGEEKRRAFAEAKAFGLPFSEVKPRRIIAFLQDISGDADNVSMSDITMLFWALMLEDRPAASLKDAGRLIDDLRRDGKHEQVMSDAILAAFPEADEGDAAPGK